MGRGATVVFGKITLSSEVDSIDKLVTKLDGILAKHGYPEKKQEDGFGFDQTAPNAPKNVEEVKQIVKEASPAQDSLETLKKEVEEDWEVAEDEEDFEDEFPEDDKA